MVYILAYQKSRFGYVLEGLVIEIVGKFYGYLEYFPTILEYLPTILVYFTSFGIFSPLWYVVKSGRPVSDANSFRT
jgi:hypothetical protein